MVKVVAAAVVLLSAVYLLGFGALAIAAPRHAAGYLQGTAGTLRLHVTEMVARWVVGISFIAYASSMRFGSGFEVAGHGLTFSLRRNCVSAVSRWSRP